MNSVTVNSLKEELTVENGRHCMLSLLDEIIREAIEESLVLSKGKLFNIFFNFFQRGNFLNFNRKKNALNINDVDFYLSSDFVLLIF